MGYPCESSAPYAPASHRVIKLPVTRQRIPRKVEPKWESAAHSPQGTVGLVGAGDPSRSQVHEDPLVIAKLFKLVQPVAIVHAVVEQ